MSKVDELIKRASDRAQRTYNGRTHYLAAHMAASEFRPVLEAAVELDIAVFVMDDMKRQSKSISNDAMRGAQDRAYAARDALCRAVREVME